MKTTVKNFGKIYGVEYDEIIIEKENEFRISFSDLGARLNSWQVPNEKGQWDNIILGFNDAEHLFEEDGQEFGATIGRVAGRIAEGEFEFQGEKYRLPQNNNGHHLHGGDNSFSSQKWEYSIEEENDQVAVTFEWTDPAGKNGYPGNLKVQVTHTVTENNEWILSYKAEADAATLFNPTNHVYFNLNGHVGETVENHIIELKADQFIPVDNETLPLGRYEDVEKTAFDLRQGRRFGDILEAGDDQVDTQQGFDHPFVLGEDEDYNGVIRLPEEKRELFFKTEKPTVVIYTLNDPPEGTKMWGEPVKKHSGITLETQKEPDAINQPNFSSIVLESGQVYESETKYWLKNENEEER